MKRFLKIFSLIAILFATLTLSGCSQSNDFKEVTLELDLPILIGEAVDENQTFVGLYVQNEKEGKLYLPGSSVPKGTYQVVTVENSKITDKVYSYPNMKIEGLTFAGWYETSNFEKGTRVATSSTVIEENVLYARYINYADAAIISVVCILIVFSMLALLWGIVAMFKYIAPKEENKASAPKAAPAPVVSAPQKAFTMDDIKDEDMMAAALVATIDYHNETGENVRVVSVKQIG